MRKSATLESTYVSPGEKKLFDSIGVGHLYHKIDAIKLYYVAMEKAFVCNMKGADIEALRRAINAISICSPYRGTDEFERLIEF